MEAEEKGDEAIDLVAKTQCLTGYGMSMLRRHFTKLVGVVPFLGLGEAHAMTDIGDPSWNLLIERYVIETYGSARGEESCIEQIRKKLLERFEQVDHPDVPAILRALEDGPSSFTVTPACYHPEKPEGLILGRQRDYGSVTVFVEPGFTPKRVESPWMTRSFLIRDGGELRSIRTLRVWA